MYIYLSIKNCKQILYLYISKIQNILLTIKLFHFKNITI